VSTDFLVAWKNRFTGPGHGTPAAGELAIRVCDGGIIILTFAIFGGPTGGTVRAGV